MKNELLTTIFRLIFVTPLLFEVAVARYHAWSFQAKLQVPDAGATYGQVQSFYRGRGFSTLVSGYSSLNGSIYVHTTDTGYLDNGLVIWTQQATLVPKDHQPYGSFGQSIVGQGNTLLVSSPYDSARASESGAIYVFNGTLRHWTQIQKLIPSDLGKNSHFGAKVALDGDYFAASSVGYNEAQGAVYVYKRNSDGLTWSKQSKLVGEDSVAGNYFGASLALCGDTIMAGARNDDIQGDRSGSVYVFRYVSSAWTQVQKILAMDLIHAFPPIKDEKYFGLISKFFADTIALTASTAAFGIRNLVNTSLVAEDSVFVFGLDEDRLWTLQQKLFSGNDTGAENSTKTEVIMKENKILATAIGSTTAATYVFTLQDNKWSQQQRITYSEAPSNTSSANFTYPSLRGGHLTFGGGAAGDTANTLLYSTYQTTSCLRIFLTDHFKDGWDTAVLTVRAPDSTNDTFHPHCDQVDPFYFRYCPYQPEDSGIYIIKVFDANKARFFWELSWQVMVESTGVVYKGDFATKMKFYFDENTTSFSFHSGENMIDENDACMQCTAIETKNWNQLRASAATSFMPTIITGAPYYISDWEGRVVYASGRICNNNTNYQCYVNAPDGVYILRLGGGMFPSTTGYPLSGSSWQACGWEGTAREQLIFHLTEKECTPIQKFNYSSRCSRPPSVDLSPYGVKSSGKISGGTMAPTQSVFGAPYNSVNMYDVGELGAHNKNSDNLLHLTKKIAESKGAKKRSDEVNKDLSSTSTEQRNQPTLFPSAIF